MTTIIHTIKESMTSLTKVDEVTFEFSCVFTWGVKKDKYMGYSVPITLDEETVTKISELADKNNAKNPLYGKSNTLYLNSKNLSPKQRQELLNKGRSHVLVNFTLEGINTSKGVNHLSFKISKLRKVECDDDDDECPED